MTSFWTKRKEAALKLSATLALCLMVLQLFASAVSLGRQSGVTGLGTAEAAFALCAELDIQSGDKAPPAHAHKDCLACALGQAGSSLAHAILPAKSAGLEMRLADTTINARLLGGSGPDEAGFASSWSSRAPPFFS